LSFEEVSHSTLEGSATDSLCPAINQLMTLKYNKRCNAHRQWIRFYKSG